MTRFSLSQIAFVLAANMVTVAAVGFMAGVPAAMLYVLGLRLGLVLGAAHHG
jgi:hypothetical protein